jgi:dihydroorotase-like cyclic amidohydrolase
VAVIGRPCIREFVVQRMCDTCNHILRGHLKQASSRGDIDTVATDHVHRDATAKAGGIWAASPGCPGLETLLPVLLTEGHHKRGMPLERVAEVSATTPARLMGLGQSDQSLSAMTPI